MKLFSSGLRLVVLLAAVLLIAAISVSAPAGENLNAPIITRIEFPNQIKPNGEAFTGKVYFKDRNGDIVKAEFNYAINPDGSQKWSYDTGDDISSSLAMGRRSSR